MKNPDETQICPDWLFDFIRCPISKTRLSPATAAFLEQLKARHAAKPLCTHGGRTISAIPTQGLLSGDACWLYPVQDQIPSLIPDEAIAVGQAL